MIPKLESIITLIMVIFLLKGSYAFQIFLISIERYFLKFCLSEIIKYHSAIEKMINLINIIKKQNITF